MQQRFTLTPPQKAAAVLIAMGKPRAKQLLKYFKSDELRRMIDAGHTLKALSQTDVDALVGEFEQAFVEGSGLIDTRDAIDAIMGDALDDEPEPTAPAPAGNGDRPSTPWELIAGVDAETLAGRLASEPPQLVAALLSQLPSGLVAGVIEALPEQAQTQVVTIMMTAREVPGERLLHVGRALVRDLKLDQGGNGAGHDAAPMRVAEIFNAMDKQKSDELMRRVRERIEPKKLAQLEQRLFRFDDLVLLDPGARTLIVDGLPSELLVTALRNAGPDLREAALSSISQRARKMIESELSAGGQDTPAQIAEAQKTIAQLAMKLASEGRFDLPKRS
ncbi:MULTISPECIES: FliG C-terminal domain-containing protein [unclassified Roseitalea]|uniref:FliG C-terminal domain-containing protein n=1 Tax=unclassified Roseitalea TaxID=2639107 RepID=UPI00273FB154|nr:MULTISPECIES: FliG C-terminal domain-containing protein [unclassified Roseitalea]